MHADRLIRLNLQYLIVSTSILQFKQRAKDIPQTTINTQASKQQQQTNNTDNLMHHSQNDQHPGHDMTKPNSTSSSPNNLFPGSMQSDVYGSASMKLGGMTDKLQYGTLGLDGHGPPGSMLMHGSGGPMMSSVGLMTQNQTNRLHSGEKEMHLHRQAEFTATKYGADRSGNSSYDNEKTLNDKLEVTVIPVDEEPYSKIITIPQSMIGSSSVHASGSGGPSTINGSAQIQSSNNLNSNNSQSQQQYPSLKDIFQAKDSLWKPIYGSFVQVNKQPLFSIFRKKITIKPDSKIQHPQGEEIGLHILFLKCDGNRFPRNAFANQLEVYCSTYFYGPLVIVYGELSPPYKLHSFQTVFLTERIQPLNEEEQKIYPLPFSAKKCSTVRNLMAERKFTMDLDQHEKTMSLEEFMIYSYKTSFCPYINKKHEWSECNYAHRQQDFRRPPHLYFYYLERCSYVQDDGSWEQCPDYLDCQFSHTLVEQLFSPLNYKLRPCPDRVPDQKFQCKKRLDLCCHNHSQEEKNLAIKALRSPPKILPEHESMQDYIDIIDQEGLLNNKQNDDFDENGQQVLPGAASKTAMAQASAAAGQGAVGASSSQSTQQIQKKAALAKLPEENQDKWRQLEQEMNKQSLQKKDKDGGLGSSSKGNNSRDSPETNAYSALAAAARFPGDHHDSLSGLLQNPTGAQQSFGSQFGAAGLPGQQLGQGALAGMAFLDSEAMGPGSGNSVKPLNTLASILEITAADGYLDGHGAPGNSGPPNLLSELDALDDEVLNKMKKRKSHHYAGSTSLGASHLGSQFGAPDSVGILGGLMGQRQPEPREDDYVQQMIKANSTHNTQFMSKNGSLKTNALGNSLTANEQIKVLKAEVRKGKKKVKKSVKVQEFTATPSAQSKGQATPGQSRKESSPEHPHPSTANESNSAHQQSSCSQSASFHTAYNMSVHTNANSSIAQRHESPLRADAVPLEASQAQGAKVQQQNPLGGSHQTNNRASASIDSKTSRKKNAQKTSRDPSSPFAAAEEDNLSQSSQPRQRNLWANEGSMKEEGNDEELEALAMGAPAAVLAIDDEPEQSLRPMAPASAQKGVQQLLEYEDKNQSAASSSSKAKQSAGRKSMRSLEPQTNLHNPAAGAEGSHLWKGEDNSALSKKSFTTTPSQQRHKRTLREGQRMQEDLLRVQSVLEEHLIQQVNSRQPMNSHGNPFALAADRSEQKSLLVVPDNSQSTALKAYQTASPEKSSCKLSKKSAGGSKQGQANQNASKNSQQQSLGGTDSSAAKVQYKYARKSVGASTNATGAANTSTKLGGAQLYAAGAGPPPAQGGAFTQRGRPSGNAVENMYVTGRNSVIFKLSERKYKDSSRFCDLQSSSSNDSSKDQDCRVEDAVSNVSHNFNEKIIVADEDMQVRNNYTSSFLDYDLLLGGQRRKHDSDIYKQQLNNSSTDGFPQQPPNSLFTFNFLNDDQTQSTGQVHQVQKAQTPVQQHLQSIYSSTGGTGGKPGRGGGPVQSSNNNLSFTSGAGSGSNQKRPLYFVQQQQASYDRRFGLGAGNNSRSRAREKQQQNQTLQGGKSSQKLNYKQLESSSSNLLTQTAQMQQKHDDRLQQQLGQPLSAAAANYNSANVVSARNQSSSINQNNYK